MTNQLCPYTYQGYLLQAQQYGITVVQNTTCVLCCAHARGGMNHQKHVSPFPHLPRHKKKLFLLFHPNHTETSISEKALREGGLPKRRGCRPQDGSGDREVAAGKLGQGRLQQAVPFSHHPKSDRNFEQSLKFFDLNIFKQTVHETREYCFLVFLVF